MYLAESISLQQAGFQTAVISLESLSSDLAQICPMLTPDKNIVYRGWMLSAPDYQKLVERISEAGANAYTLPSVYLATHYLPNWYHLIEDLTPETHFYPTDVDLESELGQLRWTQFFIKDYVKSLKTSIGSIIDRPSDINLVMSEMHKFLASTHLCSNTLKPLPKMDLSVREFDCPHCNQRHDRDINAAINIKNEGLRVLTLGTSVIAPEGYVRPKQYGRKSTTVAAVVVEGRSHRHSGTPLDGG